jgi:hypothetical protein
MTTHCTSCGIALKVRAPRLSAARWVHTATPPVPHVAETDAPIAPQVGAADRATFDRILDLEHQAQITKNVAGFIVGDGHAAQKREQAKLFAALAALTPAQAAAFGAYRKARR